MSTQTSYRIIESHIKDDHRDNVIHDIESSIGYGIVLDDCEFSFGSELKKLRSQVLERNPNQKFNRVYLLNFDKDRRIEYDDDLVRNDKYCNLYYRRGTFSNVIESIVDAESEQTLSVLWYDGTSGYTTETCRYFKSTKHNIDTIFNNNMVSNRFTLFITINNSRKNVNKDQIKLYCDHMDSICGFYEINRQIEHYTRSNKSQNMLFTTQQFVRISEADTSYDDSDIENDVYSDSESSINDEPELMPAKRRRVQVFGNLYDGLDEESDSEQSFEEESDDESSD